MGYELKDNESAIVINDDGYMSMYLPKLPEGTVQLENRPSLLLAVALSRLLASPEGTELMNKFMTEVMKELNDKVNTPCGGGCCPGCTEKCDNKEDDDETG